MWKAIWKWIREKMLKVSILEDWIVSIEDSRAHEKLRKHFAPLIEEATRTKNDLERQNLYAEWMHEQSQIDEPTYAAASDRLVRKARWHYVPVPDTRETMTL
jgi:predicted transcriptional regulator